MAISLSLSLPSLSLSLSLSRIRQDTHPGHARLGGGRCGGSQSHQEASWQFNYLAHRESWELAKRKSNYKRRVPQRARGSPPPRVPGVCGRAYDHGRPDEGGRETKPYSRRSRGKFRREPSRKSSTNTARPPRPATPATRPRASGTFAGRSRPRSTAARGPRRRRRVADFVAAPAVAARS